MAALWGERNLLVWPYERSLRQACRSAAHGGTWFEWADDGAMELLWCHRHIDRWTRPGNINATNHGAGDIAGLGWLDGLGRQAEAHDEDWDWQGETFRLHEKSSSSVGAQHSSEGSEMKKIMGLQVYQKMRRLCHISDTGGYRPASAPLEDPLEPPPLDRDCGAGVVDDLDLSEAAIVGPPCPCWVGRKLALLDSPLSG
jgi:hypothetical protein